MNSRTRSGGRPGAAGRLAWAATGRAAAALDSLIEALEGLGATFGPLAERAAFGQLAERAAEYAARLARIADLDELEGFLEHLAGEVYDRPYRTLLEGLLGDRELRAAWRRAPCSRAGHHAYLGGLLEHVLALVRV